ncbi:MAG: hypothetical protein ACUZ8H_09240 [Candidatus Anammoxibacter sp.]
MYAIEFETDIKDGHITVPEQYKNVNEHKARVIVLIEENGKEKKSVVL